MRRSKVCVGVCGGVWCVSVCVVCVGREGRDDGHARRRRRLARPQCVDRRCVLVCVVVCGVCRCVLCASAVKDAMMAMRDVGGDWLDRNASIEGVCWCVWWCVVCVGVCCVRRP